MSLSGVDSGAAPWKAPGTPQWEGGIQVQEQNAGRGLGVPVTRASAPAHPVAFPCLPSHSQTMWPAGAGPTTLAAFTKQQTLMENRKEGGERREQYLEATPSPHFTALRQEGRISVAPCPACLQCNGRQEPCEEVGSVTELCTGGTAAGEASEGVA